MGEISLNFSGIDKTDYSRSLDLSNAVHTVKSNGCTAETFSSYPDKISAYRIKTNKPFSVKIKAKSKLKYQVDTEKNNLFLLGNAPDYAAPNYFMTELHPISYNEKKGMAFCLQAQVQTNGEICCKSNRIKVKNATELTLYFATSTGFHPWEGGEGKAPAQYVAALCTLAKAEIEKNEPEKAIALLNRTFEYPHNLGEGKLYGAQENLQNYLLGLAYEKLSNSEKATEYFEKASTGLSEPQSTMYYNDQPPETIFCQGLALLKLGKTDEANIRFNKLISYADEHMNDNVKIDYFAANVYSKIAVPPNSNSLN